MHVWNASVGEHEPHVWKVVSLAVQQVMATGSVSSLSEAQALARAQTTTAFLLVPVRLHSSHYIFSADGVRMLNPLLRFDQVLRRRTSESFTRATTFTECSMLSVLRRKRECVYYSFAYFNIFGELI